MLFLFIKNIAIQIESADIFYRYAIQRLLRMHNVKLAYINEEGRLISFIHNAIDQCDSEIFNMLTESPAFKANSEGPLGRTPLFHVLLRAHGKEKSPSNDFYLNATIKLAQCKGIDLEQKLIHDCKSFTVLEIAYALDDVRYPTKLVCFGAITGKLSVNKEQQAFPCAFCKKEGCTKRCICRHAYYCNADCQRNDWQEHKAKFFDEHKPK